MSFQFLLPLSEAMSAPAMPAEPKLACRTVSLGAAWACNRQTNGAADVASIDFKAARRDVRSMGGFLSSDPRTQSVGVRGWHRTSVSEGVARRKPLAYAIRARVQ